MTTATDANREGGSLDGIVGRIACGIGLHKWKASPFVVDSILTIHGMKNELYRYTKYTCRRCDKVKVARSANAGK